jgi:hypothetical protein
MLPETLRLAGGGASSRSADDVMDGGDPSPEVAARACRSPIAPIAVRFNFPSAITWSGGAPRRA